MQPLTLEYPIHSVKENISQNHMEIKSRNNTEEAIIEKQNKKMPAIASLQAFTQKNELNY